MSSIVDFNESMHGVEKESMKDAAITNPQTVVETIYKFHIFSVIRTLRGKNGNTISLNSLYTGTGYTVVIAQLFRNVNPA